MYKAAGVWAVAGELVLLHWDQWGVIREQGQLSQAAIQNCGAEVCSQHYLWIQFKYEWAIFLTKTHPYTCSPASLLPQIQSDSMETLYQDNNVSSKNKKERKTRWLPGGCIVFLVAAGVGQCHRWHLEGGTSTCVHVTVSEWSMSVCVHGWAPDPVGHGHRSLLDAYVSPWDVGACWFRVAWLDALVWPLARSLCESG